jgi:hypothetical protein
VRAAWEEHQTGRRDRAPALWTVLMLAGWLEARQEQASQERARA